MNYIASIGFFDGVHLGHLSLIHQLQARAQALELGSVLITFSTHPRERIEGTGPQLLLSHDERIHRLQQSGVDRLIELDFNAVHSLTAEAFLRYLHTEYQVEALLMGYDHRFGSDRLTSLNDYQTAGAQAGITIYLAQQAPEGNVSSTKIRRALQEGRLEEANQMLGYNYTLTGQVVHGQHIGTSLGFPTANLLIPSPLTPHPSPITPHPSPILLPKQGVYAARVRDQKALVNIGTNPTFGENQPLSIEVHIPGFQGDLYGQTLTVELISYLREDRRFGSKQLLIGQILQDIENLAHLLY